LMATQLVSLADELCGRRLIMVLEGGYDLDVLGSSVVATLAALGGAVGSDPLGAPIGGHAVDVEPTIAEVRRAHPWWFTGVTR